ncbi:TIGR03943 family protein [Streptococcus merionis]|uniref:TIGR03943 family putative permease subunit n=1 Tax=Streptococcus merionis TaxID=400065 RepID=UPI0026EA9E97|nr:TIGR03943 family protein [Streptococcus merionis]
MLRFLILFGYFQLSIYLYLSGKLDQYINLKYSYLTYISMVISLILAIVQLIVWVKNMKTHSHLTKWSDKVESYGLLIIPLIVGTLFPTVTLDANTVSAKGYSFPLAVENDPATQEQEGTTTQYLRPDTSSFFTKSAYTEEMQKALDKYVSQDHIEVTRENYMEVMEIIYDYPDQFVGKTITFTGFAYQDPDNSSNLFLFRFGIIHCIADSGVFGLLLTNVPKQYDNDTWLSATGKITITYHQKLNQSLPTVEIETLTPIEKPDNQYVYRVF